MRARWLVPVVGLLGACQQPPNREIAAAEAQMEQARQAGADRYAANQWREAQQALDQARAKVQSRDYRGALSSANDAADKARAAARASAPAKGVVKSSTEMTQAEIRSTLDEVASIRQQGIAAQVSDEAFSELDQRTEEARDASQRVAEMLEHGDVIDAQKAATELKARVAPLPEAYREASARWQAEHPRPVRRKR